MSLEDQYRYLVGGYYGVKLMDEYSLKEYVLKDIDDYINSFLNDNFVDNYEEIEKDVKDNVSNKTKLQDALLVLNKINGSMELVLLIKKRLKKYK